MAFSTKEKQNAYARRWHARYRVWYDKLKDKPCKDCHRRFPSECMDWDHVRGQKKGRVSAMVNLSRARLLREIKKCDLICANCHRMRTKKRKYAKGH